MCGMDEDPSRSVDPTPIIYHVSHEICGQELDNWQKEKRVVQYPSLLTFLGYA